MLDSQELGKPVPNKVFVDSLIQTGKISPTLGEILKAIETSTATEGEAMTRKKIETVVNFRIF